MLNRKHLIACWANELSLLEALLADHPCADVVIFDDNADTVDSPLLPKNVRQITFNQRQFTYREPVFKGPNDLALWLFAHANEYDLIMCSQQGGLGYFVRCLNRSVINCVHWDIQWFGEVNTINNYKQRAEFLDKPGILRAYIENNQQLSSSLLAPDTNASVQDAKDLTVVIPFHNRTEFLAQALRSLCEQRIQGFQTFIVNDDSDKAATDFLIELIGKPEYRVLNISLYHSKKPLGASGARNLAIENITTVWTLFLDDDDVLASEAIEYCLYAQQRTDCDVVTMAFCYFDGDSYPQTSSTKGQLIHFHSDQDWTSALTYNCIGGITAMYRTELLRQYGGFNCGQYAGEEDWQLLLSLSIANAQFTYLPLPLLWYRNTPFSLSKKMLHYDSRMQLCKLYQQILPPQLAFLPEFVAAQQRRQKNSDVESAFARLGWQLHAHQNQPLYIYGAGELGSMVVSLLYSLGMIKNLQVVIDRNAAFIRQLDAFNVVTLDNCEFMEGAVVIIASLSFIDEIEQQLPFSIQHIIRMD
jgi:hypothetical protein